MAAAYALDSQTGAWSRWFADNPDVSTLPPLNDMQGVLALGGATAAAALRRCGCGRGGGRVSQLPARRKVVDCRLGRRRWHCSRGRPGCLQGLLVEFDVAADGLGIDRVKFGFEGQLEGAPCEGLMNMTFGRAQPIVDNGFTINDTDYTLTGRFDSATTSTGELQVHIPDRFADPGCFSDPLTGRRPCNRTA